MTRYFYEYSDCIDFCNTLDSLAIEYRREYDDYMELYTVTYFV